MYKEFFKQLAEKENGKFYFKDENIAFGNGTRSPNITYAVEFGFKGNHFLIYNRTGTAYVANIICKLSKLIQPIEFKINNISHFHNLFVRRKSRLRVIADNQNIKHFLLQNENFKSLQKIADLKKFSPFIFCRLDNEWIINCEYHLEFDDWTEPVELIIALYKDCINQFEK